MKNGMTRFRPGEFKTVESAGLLIRDNIVPLPMPEPSQVLFMLTDYLVKSMDSITATSKVLTGDLPPNIAATTALAGIEQGLVPFKAVFRRVHRALEKEFKRIFELNKRYLNPEEYAEILDDPNADFVKDYVESNTDIVPVSDLEMMTNMQNLIKAQALMDFKDDPLIDQIEIRKRILEAIGVPDIDKLIKAPSNAPDPLAQAQVAAFEAQIIDLKARAESTIRDSARKDMQAADEHIKMQADMLKVHADALYALARAESEEKGTQLAEYSTMLNLLKEQLNASTQRQSDPREQPDDTQQRLPSVDEAPSNEPVRPVPDGL
jgi:chaperonin GroES